MVSASACSLSTNHLPQIIKVHLERLDVHVHLVERLRGQVQQLRVRYRQPDVVVGREAVLQGVHHLVEGFHLFALDFDGVGEEAVRRTGTRRYLPPDRAVQRRTGRHADDRVQ